MRPPRPLALLLLLGIAAAIFLWWRGARGAAAGPAIALCPGPDAYGSTCAVADAYSYVDAGDDTGLYADDDTVLLSLPFPFIFYGQTYTEVRASSNGNLQFTTTSGAYANRCLDAGPVAGLGAMIAPYWDDLDLTLTGTLETAVVGQAPRRTFVVEWDEVPRFGGGDAVTFAAQLFEESGDIVFLYQEVETEDAPRGASATVGLQSEAAGMALQYSCNQPTLANARGLLWRHPEDPGPVPAAAGPAASRDDRALKGEAPDILSAWQAGDAASLRQVQARGLRQAPARPSQWRRIDLTGDGREELIWLWGGPTPRLLVLDAEQALHNAWLATRALPAIRPALAGTGDVTGDGRPDALLVDHAGTGLWLVTQGETELTVVAAATFCPGPARLVDRTGDGRPDVVRDGCADHDRQILTWDGEQLVEAPAIP